MQAQKLRMVALVPLTFLLILLFAPAAGAESGAAAPAITAPVNTTPSQMEISVYVNSIDDIDMVKGTYTVDGFLNFKWTDPSKTTANFEFMNGKLESGPDSLVKVWDNKSGSLKEESYRFRADFRITPNNMDYPYESGVLPITIEDSTLDSTQFVYVPLPDESEIEPGFYVPGWKLGTPTFSVRDHNYPHSPPFSEVSYNIPITNDALASLLQTVVPPLIFCIIAALSFFISVRHAELVHLRYVLTTSMFISAVMYHFGQLALIPGLGVLKLFDKFMIAVYLFLAVTVIVTTLCYLAQQQWERPDLVRPINRYGAIVSFVLPIVCFWILFAFM